MTARDDLYEALGPDLESVTTRAFAFALRQLRKRGGFMPTGAVLQDDGRVGIMTTVFAREPVGRDEVLVSVREGLERLASASVVALAVIDWVEISGAGQTEQLAVKLHVHHRRGLAVVFYAPASRAPSGEWTLGDTIARAGDALIDVWPMAR